MIGIIKAKPLILPGYSYYKFEVSAPQTANFQLSEFGFYTDGAYQSVGGAAPTGTRRNPMRVSANGSFPPNEIPEYMFDNNVATKHYNAGVFPIILTFFFDLPIKFIGYNWCTANDTTPGRNPKDWTLAGCNDGSSWVTIDTQTNQGATPATTFTWAAGWPLSY